MTKRKRKRTEKPKQLILFTSEGGNLPTQEQMSKILELAKINPRVRQMLTPLSFQMMQRKGLLD